MNHRDNTKLPLFGAKLLTLVSQSIITRLFWHLAYAGARRGRTPFLFERIDVILARCRLIRSWVREGLRSAGSVV